MIKLNKDVKWILIILLLVVIAAAIIGHEQFIKNKKIVQVIPITVAKVVAYPLDYGETTLGSLASLTAPSVKAETNGRVIKILTDVGQSVKEGQELAELDSGDQAHELAADTGRIEQLKAEQVDLRLAAERFRKLITSKAISQAELDTAESKLRAVNARIITAIEEAEKSKKQLNRTQIIAPVAGKVQQRNISVGDYVSVGMPAFELVTTDTLRATLPFPETVRENLRVGQAVFLTTSTVKDKVITARINDLTPMIDETNRSFNAIVDFTNPGNWQPGASVEGKVIVNQNPKAIMVPVESVVVRPLGNVVYVVTQDKNKDKGKVIERKVVTGQIQNDLIEIRSGLKAGEIIANDGAPYLSDQVHVKIQP